MCMQVHQSQSAINLPACNIEQILSFIYIALAFSTSDLVDMMYLFDYVCIMKMINTALPMEGLKLIPMEYFTYFQNNTHEYISNY